MTDNLPICGHLPNSVLVCQLDPDHGGMHRHGLHYWGGESRLAAHVREAAARAWDEGRYAVEDARPGQRPTRADNPYLAEGASDRG